VKYVNRMLTFILFSTACYCTAQGALTASEYQPVRHNVIVNNKINPVYPGYTYPMSKLQEMILNKQNIATLQHRDSSFYIVADATTGKPIPVGQKGAFTTPLENVRALPAETVISLEQVKNFSFKVYQDIDLVEKLVAMGRIQPAAVPSYRAIMLYFILQTADHVFHKIYLTNPWPTVQEAAQIITCYNVGSNSGYL
jgi:hypothetical protein